MPLRASNFLLSELKHVVIVSDKEYIAKEWKGLCNFPKITIINVSRVPPFPFFIPFFFCICLFIGFCFVLSMILERWFAVW